MRISHYFEWEDKITGGLKQSVKNQRKILDRRGIDYTTEPDLDADILHLNNMGPKSVYYAKKAKKKGVPVVIHAHNPAKDFGGSFKFSNLIAGPMQHYLNYAYSLGDHLICPSKHNKEVHERNGIDVEKTVVSNGFDSEKLEGYEDLREEYLERYDLEPPVVFCVGHVIPRKGLEAFVETARNKPELDFVWFGYINPTGDFMGRLLQTRKTKKIIKNSPENCTFTGFIEDVRGAFAAGDIFFFPTKDENEGMALLEAMSTGKPPLVRDIEVFDWLESGENALKTENFENALEKLKDEELRERIGTNAEKRSEEFSLDRIGDKIASVYNSV
ncbi:MAG: glycosyltransferase family 4 protein [Nanohaloarchaea archaeon]|nr:glycosyltransferase family 4 protein [Candidatus Nanohaloarchaea archaeon]